jgi:YHS domain-containing protein
MTRALIELLIIIILVIGARSVLNSLFRGFSNAVGRRPDNPATAVPASGELHKDPVCGTYVAGSSHFQRQQGSKTFYYCSAECRDRHGLAAAKVS